MDKYVAYYDGGSRIFGNSMEEIKSEERREGLSNPTRWREYSGGKWNDISESSIPTGGTSSGSSRETSGGYDPFAEAEKHGYTRSDFDNDPGFYNYWKNKTPEQLLEKLKLRSDWSRKNPGDTTDDTTGDTTGDTNEEYDPYEEALKYGYTRDDFRGDADFLDYWKNKTPEQLLRGLQARDDWDSGTGRKGVEGSDNTGELDTPTPEPKLATDDQAQARYDEALLILDNALADGSISRDQYEVWKVTLDAYPPGIEFEAQEVLDTFNRIKNETIDPHYREVIDMERRSFSDALEAREQERAMEIEAERTRAGQSIRQTKAGLEKAGMTFTGRAIEELGAESAYSQEGGGVIPSQTPTEGSSFYEGLVPQQNRLLASSSKARYENAIKNLGQQAEGRLGTAGATSLGFGGMVGGITGSVQDERQGAYGQSLNQLMDQYRIQQS